jgi:hypothetical protein
LDAVADDKTFVAAAFNSILCRLALRGGEADAAGFTAVRLVSGAVALVAIRYFLGKTSNVSKPGNWVSAFFLFASMWISQNLQQNPPKNPQEKMQTLRVETAMVTLAMKQDPERLIWF